MQNLSTLLSPLYALLRKKVPWEWRKEQEAFEKTKTLLKSPKLLAHYDSNRVDSDMRRIIIWARCCAIWKVDRNVLLCMHHEHSQQLNINYTQIDILAYGPSISRWQEIYDPLRSQATDVHF